MPVESVQFSGTLSNQNTVTEKTQSKFEGTGKIVSPFNRPLTIALTVSFTVTLTLALTFKFIFNVDFDEIFKLLEISAPPQKEQIEPPAEPPTEPPTQILRSPGINGYSVVVRVFDNGADAAGLQYLLRQKRVNAKYGLGSPRWEAATGRIRMSTKPVNQLGGRDPETLEFQTEDKI